ncbi:MAG: type II toxin-antitoxin system VapC family toxin [Hyphomicrobiaceae bacterium]
MSGRCSSSSGRIGLRLTDTDGRTWVRQALKRAPLREAPVTHAVAMESERLLLDHWDPADRLIAETARVLDATLVTADEHLIEARDLKVLANR